MKKHCSILLICLCCLSFGFKNKSLELTGKITSEHGFVIPRTYVQLLENGEIIAQTKSDNFGNYKLLLPKIGKFTLKAGYKSKFFHPEKIKNYEVSLNNKFQQNCILSIDKQVLH